MLSQMAGFPSFLQLDSIPLCVCFVCECGGACVYNHNLFIHSSIDGHFGWFHVQTIVTSSAPCLTGEFFTFKFFAFKDWDV